MCVCVRADGRIDDTVWEAVGCAQCIDYCHCCSLIGCRATGTDWITSAVSTLIGPPSVDITLSF